MNMLLLKYIKSMSKYFLIFIVLCFLSTALRKGPTGHQRFKRYDIWQVINKAANQDLKYILIWTQGDKEWESFGERQNAFIELECPYDNCYITKDRTLFRDYTKFDAILINGKSLVNERDYVLPKMRKPNQLFIFASKDSAAEYPVCDKSLDNYFNLTMTYKLNSDIPWTYFTINDLEERVVGPKIDMQWPKEFYPAPVDAERVVNTKALPAIWYATKCQTKSRREFLISKINMLLKRYAMEIEPIGSCGGLPCTSYLEKPCLSDLNKYYFYMAFEDSMDDDYVTDNVLNALLNYAIPIVFGGANYSRFLPPNSYIDAGDRTVEDIAFKMAYLFRNHTAYMQYLRWHSHFTYTRNQNVVCQLCEAVNKDIKKVYTNFGEWWNPKSFRSYGRKPSYNVCSRLKHTRDLGEV